jgi:hypothetical protein
VADRRSAPGARARDGRGVRRIVGGEAALTGPWPLFTCFYWVAIFGGTQRVGGRLRPQKGRRSRHHSFWELIPRAFTPLAEPAAALCRSRPADRGARQTEIEAGRTGPDCSPSCSGSIPPFLWSGRCTSMRRKLGSGHGIELCDCLVAAKTAKYERAVRMSAQLIAALPRTSSAPLAAGC